jgi:hypothetical protein
MLTERSAPEEVVRVLLNDSKMTLGELSEMIGAAERSISRWARGDKSIVIQERYLNAIDDLRYLHSVLGSSLAGAEFAHWMRTRNRRLGGERPTTMIAADRYKEVKKAAEAFADGIPD